VGNFKKKVINNSADDYSISIKFTTDYEHVTTDLR